MSMQVSNAPRAINIDMSSNGGYTASSVDESTKLTEEMRKSDDKKKKKYGDADGDGQWDGASLKTSLDGTSGEDTDMVSIILKSQGLKMGDGGLMAVDGGYNIAEHSNGIAAVDFGSNAPILPAMTQSANVDYELMGDRLNALSANSMEDGALMWHALSETARGSREDMALTKQMRFAMEKQKYASKMKELKSKEAEIEAQKEAAVWSAVASLASIAVASVAGNGGNMALAMGAQQATTQVANAISITSGPQARANQEALNQKHEATRQSTLDEAIESLKGNYEAAREANRQALEVIQKHIELASQNISALTRG